MDKRAQYTPEEAKKWVTEDQKRWNPLVALNTSRMFFQVWNKPKGRGGSKTLDPLKPLKCTVWRDRAMNYEALLNDLISEALPAYARALEKIYPELQSMAKTNPNIELRMEIVDKILGKNPGLSLAEQLRSEYEASLERLEKEPPRKKVQPATKVVTKYYYEILNEAPGLQQQFISMIVKDLYTDFKRGAGGYWAGAGLQKQPRRLLTFYLMEDPYPYLRSEPLDPNGERYTRANGKQMCADWGGKTSPENSIPGYSMGKKVTAPVTPYKCPNGNVYVQNERNPSYDFARLGPEGARDLVLQKERVTEILDKTRKAALFDPGFHLGKNVFEQTTYPEGGVMLQDLLSYDIQPEDRDLTKLKDGGLFWVPESGLPKQEPPKEKKTTQKGKFKTTPPQANLANGLLEVFGQEGNLDEGGVWIDDQGRTHDTMDELLHTYAEELEREIEQRLPQDLAQMVAQDLEGAKIPVEMPIHDVIEPEEEEVEEPEYEEEEEEEEEKAPWLQNWEEEREALPLAAQKIERLVQIGNELDKQGLIKQADIVDEMIKRLFEQMTRHNL